MDYKTLKKELTKLAKANNVCLTFGEKKQFENGKATEYRDVRHWDYREYSIVDVEKIFNRYGTMVLESADCYNNSKYGKHDLLKTYRVYLSEEYLK